MVDIAPESDIPRGSSPAKETRFRNLRANTTINRLHQEAKRIVNGGHAGVVQEVTQTSDTQGEKNTALQQQVREALAKSAKTTASLAETPLLNPVEKPHTILNESTEQSDRKLFTQVNHLQSELDNPANYPTEPAQRESTPSETTPFVRTGERTNQNLPLTAAEIARAPVNQVGLEQQRTVQTLPLSRAEVAQNTLGPSLALRESPNVLPQYEEKPQVEQPYNHLTSSEMANGFIGPSMITVDKPQGFFSKISAGISRLGKWFTRT